MFFVFLLLVQYLILCTLDSGDVPKEPKVQKEHKSKERPRKIRFEDDDTRDPEEPEKDTRLKFKPAVSSLHAMMLKMAGQEVPMVEVEVSVFGHNFLGNP